MEINQYVVIRYRKRAWRNKWATRYRVKGVPFVNHPHNLLKLIHGEVVGDDLHLQQAVTLASTLNTLHNLPEYSEWWDDGAF